MSQPVSIQWSEALSVGIPLIDHQHKQLFELIRRLDCAVGESHSSEVMLDTLDELRHYAAAHFATEERYFEETEYPLSEAHIEKHRGFARAVESLRCEYESGSWQAAGHLLTYLAEWFTNHIANTDREFALFLQSRKAG